MKLSFETKWTNPLRHSLAKVNKYTFTCRFPRSTISYFDVFVIRSKSSKLNIKIILVVNYDVIKLVRPFLLIPIPSSLCSFMCNKLCAGRMLEHLAGCGSSYDTIFLTLNYCNNKNIKKYIYISFRTRKKVYLNKT